MMSVMFIIWMKDELVVKMLCFSHPGSVGAGGVQRLLPDSHRPRTSGEGREDQTGRRSKWEIQT